MANREMKVESQPLSHGEHWMWILFTGGLWLPFYLIIVVIRMFSSTSKAVGVFNENQRLINENQRLLNQQLKAQLRPKDSSSATPNEKPASSAESR